MRHEPKEAELKPEQTNASRLASKCEETQCPFHEVSTADKCWKCAKTRKRPYRWTDAFLQIGVSLLIGGAVMDLGLKAMGNKDENAAYFLCIFLSIVYLVVAIAAIPKLLKFTKPYYNEDGTPRKTSEICSNPRCQAELDRFDCQECGRLKDPYKPVLVALFTGVAVPAALNGTCLVGTIGSPNFYPQYVSIVSYLVSAAIVTSLVIASTRRDKKS